MVLFDRQEVERRGLDEAGKEEGKMMFKEKRTGVVGVVAGVLFLLLVFTMDPGTASAAYSAFLKIDGIAGESQEKTPTPHEIDIMTWSWGETQSSTSHTGGGGGAGKASAQNFKFTMRVNKASPQLFQACAEGKHLRSAILTVRKANGGPEFLKITFEEVVVTSYYNVGNSKSAEAYPVDEVSFSYARIKFEYKPQKADGSADAAVVGSWNFLMNKKE
jgi:type VI secretion system secreted protein Hcp